MKFFKWLTIGGVFVADLFLLAAFAVGGWETFQNCFWPSPYMNDDWAWRLISVPFALLIWLAGGMAVIFIAWAVTVLLEDV